MLDAFKNMFSTKALLVNITDGQGIDRSHGVILAGSTTDGTVNLVWR
jgi:hypothetical protein